ncbi:YopX family protein [Bacillus cereus group sp. BfR-BA-01494]|jgi:uncharacterized phage protein (TIGR01671 family)|uniref:YopX family protein n=1 Tax=Bacillus cereus group sp. BfR-BA-01494 TaxID=2920362 RepID=UPI001F585F51
MNTVTKFRAWDIKRQWMLYNRESCGYVDYEMHPIAVVNKILSGEDKNLKFMQYSGIEDVYEQEIYAGDIVYQEFHDRISEQHGFTGVVVQREGTWWICNGKDHAEMLWSEVNLNHVKGNIYENVELLKDFAITLN